MLGRRLLSGQALRVTAGTRLKPNGLTVTVFGASSFVATPLVEVLGNVGCQVVLPFRGNGDDIKDLRLNGELGMMIPVHYELKNEHSLRKTMMKSDVVINLIGREWETRNYQYDTVHVEGAARIARLAKESGVKRMIHISAMGADEDSPSKFYSSKAKGEKAVREEFPEATIMRPARIFGEKDWLFYSYTMMITRFGYMPVVGDGSAKLQPIFIEDVTRAIMYALNEPETFGKTYELAGPDVYSYEELNKVVVKYTDINLVAMEQGRFFPDLAKKAIALFCTLYPFEPKYLTNDGFIRTGIDTLPNPNELQIQDLGVDELVSVEDVAAKILFPFKQSTGNYFRKHMPDRSEL